MSWLPKRPPEATRAIHPETLIQPVIHERSGRHFGQAITLISDSRVRLAYSIESSRVKTDLESKCPRGVFQDSGVYFKREDWDCEGTYATQWYWPPAVG